MAEQTLRFRDGFADHSPALREPVRRLQRALQRTGYSLDADGFFGRGTEELVKAFQREHGLEADGIVGPSTWCAPERGASPSSI